MQNLEQIRAAEALKFWENPDNRKSCGGEEGGDVVSKLPSLIINNGLLATLAFAKAKEGGHAKLMAEVLRFLALKNVQAMAAPTGFRQGDGLLDPGIRTLTEKDSLVLQRATAEALAYLAYLKRFAP